MSFILEALKKSEQQRQEQNDQPQKVRKRTLSLHTNRPYRRLLPWLMIALLPCILIGGWLIYRGDIGLPVSAPTAVPEPAASDATTVNPPVASAPALAVSPSVSEPQNPTVQSGPTPDLPPQPSVFEAEPAPVPKPLGSSQKTRIKTPPANSKNESSVPRLTEGSTPQDKLGDQAVPTVVFNSPLPETASDRASGSASAQVPLYSDLSREIRAQMPPLDMSMHYYTPEPARRMVRINDHLLHEGNWVDSNLQVVEITANGAILEFLGKNFELRRNRR
jgi:general secretion pathway protein B